MYPIYVQQENNDLSKRLDRVKALLKEIETETAFFSTKAPILYAVPAPSEDCIQIGGIIVCGASSLTEEQRQTLNALLLSFI